MSIKRIYDPVHGFIRLDAVESMLVDSFPFQRLHYIHQLGITYLVYPGATHTRFEHSLGVMEIATRIFDQIIEPDFSERDYWRRIIRLAALCHDLGHLPFSHVAENALLGNEGHEKWTLKIIKSSHLRPVWEKLELIYPEHDIENDLIRMSLGEKKLENASFTPWQKILSCIITADFFGADRIDYLLRDARSTGVAYGLFDYQQLIEMLRILSYQDTLTLGVEENGIASCEALLLARHFMHRRVYQHSTVKAYAFHVSRLMKKVYTDLKDLNQYLAFTESEVLREIQKAAKDRQHVAHSDARALSDRSFRFKAIAIHEIHRIKEIISILDVPMEAVHWEVVRKEKSDSSLSFPVLKGNGKIEEASRLSEIIIPSGSVGWLYIEPMYEKSVRESLSKMNIV